MEEISVSKQVVLRCKRKRKTTENDGGKNSGKRNDFGSSVDTA